MKFIYLKKQLREMLDLRKKYFPGKLKQYRNHNLSETQIYQDGLNFDVAMSKSIKNSLKNLKLKENFKIASIGTCFAEEISRFIKSNSSYGNYLYLEENIWHSSVDWGRVYTIQNLKEILKYSLNINFPIHIEKYKNKFFDPIREKFVKTSTSREDLKKLILNHREMSKKIFLNTDVLVITLGQNENWKDLEKNIYWGVMPPYDLIKKNKNRFKVENHSVSRNIKDLEWIINSIQKINNKIQFLFTVSPVSSYATFISNDVITESFAGKCILRSTIQEILQKKRPNVFYFPSFEVALAKNPTTFQYDNRHVKYKKIREIFSYL